MQDASSQDASFAETNAKARRFSCPQCGGQLQFDAKTGRLHCVSCGATSEITQQGDSASIVEYDLEKGLSEAVPRGFGLPTKSSSCQSCGAIISFGANETARTCTFCGSSAVLEVESMRQTLRPESLVPFQKTKDVAQQYFAQWLRSLWFRPNDLKRLASVSLIQGVYIPYWVFDATLDSEWWAMAGEYYYTTETYTEEVDGRTETRTREVRHTRWFPAAGSRHDIYDDHLICASRGLPLKLAAKLDSFDTHQLNPYDPSYLAGWRAEEYQLDLKPAWQQAVREIEQSQYDRCGRDVPGDTFMSLNVSNTFSETRFKHVLLPIWIAGYRYRDKTYQFLVNGQTGEVEGDAPYSVWKIAFFVLALLALMIVFLMIYAGQQSAHR